MLSVMACAGRGTSSFSLNTRLHPSCHAGRHADLIVILLNRSNTTCITCVVSILSQILATTALVNTDNFAGVGWPGCSPQQSTAIDSVDDLRLCISFFTHNLQFILQHRFTSCPHFSVISKHDCRVWGHFIRDKAIGRYDLSYRCHDPDDTCAYELSVCILRSDGYLPCMACQFCNGIYFLTKVRLAVLPYDPSHHGLGCRPIQRHHSTCVHCVVRQSPYDKGCLAQCCNDYPGSTMPIMHACGFDEEIRPDAVPEPLCVVHDLFACHKPLEQCRVKMLHRPEIE